MVVFLIWSFSGVVRRCYVGCSLAPDPCHVLRLVIVNIDIAHHVVDRLARDGSALPRYYYDQQLMYKHRYKAVRSSGKWVRKSYVGVCTVSHVYHNTTYVGGSGCDLRNSKYHSTIS